MATALDNILGILGEQRANLEATKSKMIDAYGAQRSAYGGLAGSEAREFKAMQVIQKQKDEGELRAQENLRRAATALGTNMDDPSEIVSALGARMRDQALQVLQKSEKVAQLEANNDLFLNPLGFLRDFAVGDQVRGSLAASENQFNVAAKALAGLNQATQSTALTQQAIAETKSMATIQAGQEVLAAKASQAAARGAVNMAGTNIHLLNALNTLDAASTNYAMQMYSIGVQEEERELRKAKDAANSKVDSAILKTYNAGAELLGLPQMANTDDLKIEKSINKARADYVIMQGAQVAAGGTTQVPLGTNPIGASQVAQQLGIPLQPGELDTVRRSEKVLNGASNMQNLVDMYIAQGVPPKEATQLALKGTNGTKEERQNAAVAYLTYMNERYLTHPFSDTDSNPYALPPMAVVDYPELDTNPFLRQYVAPLIKAAKQEGQTMAPDFELIFTNAIAAMTKDGMTSAEVASGIASLSKQLALQNNLTRNYTKLGLPAQTIMPISLNINGVTGTIDLLNISDITTFLAQSLGKVYKPEFFSPYQNLLEQVPGLERYYSPEQLEQIRTGAVPTRVKTTP